MVHYKGLYAGRLDMIADVNCYRSLIDLKTTAKLDVEMLEWQLGMYKLAFETMKLGVLANTYCLWLPKRDLGDLVDIMPKSKKEIEEVSREYAKTKTNNICGI